MTTSKISALFDNANRAHILGPFNESDSMKLLQMSELHKSCNITAIFDVSNFHITKELENKIKIINYNEIFFDDECITRYIKSYLPRDSIIHFLDSDDAMTENCLQECIDTMDDKTQIIWHDFEFYYDGIKNEMQEISKFAKKDRNIVVVQPTDSLYKILHKYGNENIRGIDILKNTDGHFNFAWHGMFRAEMLNIFRTRFSHLIEYEDVNFGILLFFYAKYVKIIGRKLIYYRVRKNSIMDHDNLDKHVAIYNYLKSLRLNFSSNILTKRYFKAYSSLFIYCDFMNLAQSDSQFLECKEALIEIFKRQILSPIDIALEKDVLNALSFLKMIKVGDDIYYKESLHRYFLLRLINDDASFALIQKYIKYKKILNRIDFMKKAVFFLPKIFKRPKRSMQTILKIAKKIYSLTK